MKIEDIKAPSIEECVKRVREHCEMFGVKLSELELMARSQRMEEKHRTLAEYYQAVHRMVVSMEERLRPSDQIAGITTKEGDQYINSDWTYCRRWPWRAVWPEGYDVQSPPWRPFSSGWIDQDHHHAVENTLLYCIKNSEHLPRIAPVAGSSVSAWWYEEDTLPTMYLFHGQWIPPGIVKLFPMARCGEALAFVFHFHGSEEMEAIRRLVIAPTFEKVAEAYAIATSQRFRRRKLVEVEMAVVEADLNRTKRPFPAIVNDHPSLLRASGIARETLLALYSNDEPLSLNALNVEAGKKSGGRRGLVKKWLGDLEKVGLAKFNGVGWILGDSAYS